jgi:diaminopimelate decarboxylase
LFSVFPTKFAEITPSYDRAPWETTIEQTLRKLVKSFKFNFHIGGRAKTLLAWKAMKTMHILRLFARDICAAR